MIRILSQAIPGIIEKKLFLIQQLRIKKNRIPLGIRHLYGLRLNSLPVAVKSISPSGKETIKNYEIQLKDANGKYLASCGGDLCDLEVVVDTLVKYDETGSYKYTITHLVQSNRIPGVMELGLILDENE